MNVSPGELCIICLARGGVSKPTVSNQQMFFVNNFSSDLILYIFTFIYIADENY